MSINGTKIICSKIKWSIMSEIKESIKEEKIDEVEENLEIVDNEIKKLQ